MMRGPGISVAGDVLTQWLGPMALLSACTLALTVALTSLVAAAGSVALWCSRFFRIDSGVVLTAPGAGLWQTSPLVLVLALALLAAAIALVRRQERLPASGQ
jgi:hypothetical protein